MRKPIFGPVPVWAVRDLLRRPGEAALAGFALWAVVAFAGTSLLLTDALSRTVRTFFRSTPPLVVRKIDAGGWAPIPVADAVRIALSVPGVTGARPRIWGSVNGAGRPLTVLGDADGAGGRAGPAEAVVGAAVPDTVRDLVLTGYGRRLYFRVAGRFGETSAVATHDLVVVDPDAARRLLGIPAGHASDLAIDLFHEEEADAIIDDLARAFPWPVRILTRGEWAVPYTGGLGRRGGIALVTLVPSILALVLIVAATVRERLSRRWEIGLLKSMGWQSGDIVRFHLYRGAFIGLPAAAAGAVVAYVLVFFPGIEWPWRLLLGGPEGGARLFLDPAGAGTILLEITGSVLVPYLAAVLWPALRGATADPQDLIQQDPR